MLADHTIDPRDATFFVRPDYHEVAGRTADGGAVYEYAPGLWTVARYEDIRGLSRDPGHFCSGGGHWSMIRSARRTTVRRPFHPAHGPSRNIRPFRGLVNRRFTPRALRVGGSIRETARGLIAAAPPDEEIDFVEVLSSPFP